jgi:hypothetical protein
MQKNPPSFLRLFLGGFALGAAALMSVQAIETGQNPLVPAAQAETR